MVHRMVFVRYDAVTIGVGFQQSLGGASLAVTDFCCRR